MAPAAGIAARQHSIREVLSAGWRLFMAGMGDVFPWVLAAELVPLLPLGGKQSGSILNTDLSALFSDSLGLMLVKGGLQASLYAIAVLRLAALAGNRTQGATHWNALRAMPSVLVGYIIYELIVIVGVLFGLFVFSLALTLLDLLPAIAVLGLALIPAVIASTALALFIFPAVLERRWPFAALGESSRLAKKGWARLSLVVSVPALVLLCLWFAENGSTMLKVYHTAMDMASKLAEEGSGMDIQALLSQVTQAPAEEQSYVWRLIWSASGAFAWWYTLAVCYAEYRDLKSRAEARPH